MIGVRIAEARRRAGLSQAALAGRIGSSRGYIANLERGRFKRGVSALALARLTAALGVDIAQFGEAPSRRGAGDDGT